ncbi:MAG: hypothetical protein HY048_15200 [Acidobacteria bacterium]|nr:hypothetical protein [Acidobacteriota bacterium]
MPGRRRLHADRVSAEHGVEARLVRAVIQVEAAYPETRQYVARILKLAGR